MDCHHFAGAENYFTPVLSNADRIPQGMQKYTEEKFLYCLSFFCFSTLHAGTSGIHKFLGHLIMLMF